MQQIKISAWGNSLGFHLPRNLADSFNMQDGKGGRAIPFKGKY